MANDFKIILSASPDTTKLKTDLDNFFKSYKAPSISTSGSGSSSGSPLKPVVSDAEKLDKITQDQIKQQEKLNAEFAKYQQQVDVFLAKTQNRDLSQPGAQGALDVRNQMQGVLNGEVTPDAVAKLKDLSSAAKVADANFQGLSGGIKTTSFNLLDAAKSVGITVTAMQALQFVISQFKDGVEYIKNLDKELTNIRLVTGQSKESVYELGKEYNQTAKELGVTTLEVTKSSVEFIRQGKTATETAQLIRNATMLSKLGNLDAADSADKLTSIMNGFKFSVEETGPVLDKLVALDNSFATSVGEISTALKYSSVSAQQAGIDFDHLAAYTTVISSVTRQNAESIGQALRTLSTRFTDIKQGKLDEDGMGINNVEASLARVNIKLRDSRNNFRDVQDVIAEIGAKWKQIPETQQDEIAKAIAGTRQREQFLVLMNHQLDIQKALTTETESTGLATQRYGIYLQGAEASANKLQTSWEKTWQTTMNSDVIIYFNHLLTVILDIVDAAGGWGKVIEAWGPSGAIIFFDILIKETKEYLKLLQDLLTLDFSKFVKDLASLNDNVFGKDKVKLFVEAIQSLNTGDFSKYESDIANANKSLQGLGETLVGVVKQNDKLNDSIDNTSQKLQNLVGQDTALNDVLKDLNGSIDFTGGLMAKAALNSLTFSDIQTTLAKNPDFIKYISIENDQIKINTDALRRLDLEKAENAYATAAQKLSLDLYNKSSAETIQNDIRAGEVLKKYVDAIKDGSAYTEQLAAEQKKASEAAKKAAEDQFNAEKKAAEEKLKLYDDEKKAADDLLKLVIDMIKQEKQAEIDHLNQQKANYDELIDKRIQALDALKAETDYQNNLKKDEKKSTDIKSQIAILKLDNSPEAKAKILKLQEQLAAQTDKINQETADHKLKLEKDSLEKEKKRFDDSIKDKVQVIQNYLKQTGKITQDALNMIKNHGKELYGQLLEWNRVYGDGIDQTIVDAWNKGYNALQNYSQLLVEIKDQQSLVNHYQSIANDVVKPWDDAANAVQAYIDKIDDIPQPKPPAITGDNGRGEGGKPGAGGGWGEGGKPQTNGGDGLGSAAGGTTNLDVSAGASYHSGLDVGPAGGLRTRNNDTIRALLSPGEVVFNASQQANLLHNFIPNIIKSTSNINQSGNIFKFDNLINIEGNTDRSMIPDLNKLADQVIEKLNTATQNRGIKRPVNLFGSS